MSRDRDYSGIQNTCPKINEVISAIESDMPDDSYHTKKELVGIMEELRTANLQLRTWGNDLYREKNVLEKELESSKREFDSLKDELQDIQSQLQADNNFNHN
jgi:predicted  nucleic acid-binding Zn-ribbon protein